MNQKLAKADRRHLRQQLGDAAAAAVAEVRDVAQKLDVEHRILAREMLDFETAVARVTEARAADRRALEALREQLESAHAKISDERTQRLNLAHQQRAYVDGADADVKRELRTDRQLATGSLHNRLVVFESLTFWRRLRWVVTGRLPTVGEREREVAIPPKPGDHWPARDAHEAFWQDLGRPADPAEAHLGAVGGE